MVESVYVSYLGQHDTGVDFVRIPDALPAIGKEYTIPIPDTFDRIFPAFALKFSEVMQMATTNSSEPLVVSFWGPAEATPEEEEKMEFTTITYEIAMEAAGYVNDSTKFLSRIPKELRSDREGAVKLSKTRKVC